MTSSRAAIPKFKRVGNRTVVSHLQHGWLDAMGVDLRLIVSETMVASKPDDVSTTATASSNTATNATTNATTTAVNTAANTATQTTANPKAKSAADQVTHSPVMPGAAPIEPARVDSVDLSGLDLVQISQAVQACQRCGLCQGRQQAVPGDGVTNPRILIVGEAPGEQEDSQGKPFVGRSGQLLANMMAAIGHGRDTSVFITNVVKCRPPANRNPRDEEIAACAPYLARQIELLAPQAILAMGRFAAHALLNTDAPLQQLRQATHAIEVAGRKLPVVVSYHPAYLLRRPVDKRLAWEDLKRLKALVSLP